MIRTPADDLARVRHLGPDAVMADARYALLLDTADALRGRVWGIQYPDGMFYLEVGFPSGHTAMCCDWSQERAVLRLLEALEPLLETLLGEEGPR